MIRTTTAIVAFIFVVCAHILHQEIHQALNELSQRHAADFCRESVYLSSFQPNSLYAMDLNENPDPRTALDGFVVHPDDYILKYGWDTSPIVIEEFKLVFFTVPKVACTTFKFLFRRMMGEKNFMRQDMHTLLPHNPQANGLKYLWDYTLEEANHIMTSPEYTRAIFVRDPKARFASAYMDKAIKAFDSFLVHKCCGGNKEACEDAGRSPLVFSKLAETCENDHWRPHTYRMESKYWKYIDFVGHLETLNEDGTELLKAIGAEKFLEMGGWGEGGNSSRIFQVSQMQTHVTNANYQLADFYYPELERAVEIFYADDYANSIFGFENVIYSRNNRTAAR